MRRLKKFLKLENLIKIFLIVLLLWFIILLFVEDDYIGSLQIGFAILGIAVAIGQFVNVNALEFLRKRKVSVGIIVVLLITNICWSVGMARQKTETTNTVTFEETENGGNISDEIKGLEKNLKSLVLQDDYLLKSLEEYTNEQGSDDYKIKAIFTNEIVEWMKKWDTLTLEEFGTEYMERRKRIDEIYNIRCVGEIYSEYIRDLAVDDLKLCVEEIDKLHYDYINPELLKEEAVKYIELGDLCETLERYSEASNFYYAAVDAAWKGVEESIKYGMSKSAKESLEIMSMAYGKMDTLPTIVFDDWDHDRASIIKCVLHDLSDSFDTEFPHD